MSGGDPRKVARKQGVEILRLVAAFGVVVIHFWPHGADSPHPLLDSLVVGSSRFAVPFFFTASAYFLRRRLASPSEGWAFAWKWIRILFLVHVAHALWFTLLHVARTPDPFHHIPAWALHLATWDGLMEGVAWPLWYLHSLVACALLASAIPARWRARALLPLGAALFAMALLWGPWKEWAPAWAPSHTPLYINPRGFLFTALLPFALGLCVEPTPRRSPALVLALLGLAVQTAEILAFPAAPGQPHEYFLGSVLLGASLFWFGLDWEPSWSKGVAWGAASLPMYILQLIVFSTLLRFVAWPLVRLFGAGWATDALALSLGILPYALLCHFLASTKAWNRLFR